MTTRFYLIRHAVVEENARAMLYGTMDVGLCPDSLVAHVEVYRALAARLPRPARWIVTPLSRTRRTAEQIFRHGYPAVDLAVEPDLVEQDLGIWQGLPHAEVVPLLSRPAHAFWPMAGEERPPGGESLADVILRVGVTMDRLARTHDDEDVVVVSHGGAIRGAVAHALRIGAEPALHLSVANLSLTRIDREPEGWRVVCVNESPGM
jgi:alpha-ribazole phosphatase